MESWAPGHKDALLRGLLCYFDMGIRCLILTRNTCLGVRWRHRTVARCRNSQHCTNRHLKLCFDEMGMSYLPIPEEDWEGVVFKIMRRSSEDHVHLSDWLSILQTQVSAYKI